MNDSTEQAAEPANPGGNGPTVSARGGEVEVLPRHLRHRVLEDTPSLALRAWQQARRVGSGLITWGPALVIMAIIYRLSSQPDFGGPGWASALVSRFLGEGPLLDSVAWMLPYLDDYLSWIAHFTEYAVLALTLYWAIGRQWPHRARPWLWAWLAAVAYGVSDELHQAFVPNRHPDLRDILTDAAGAGLALFIVWLMRRTMAQRRRARGSVPMDNGEGRPE